MDHHLVGLNPIPSSQRRLPGTLASDSGLQLRGNPGEPRPVVAGGRSAEPGECSKESRPAGGFGCPVRFPEIQNEFDLRQSWSSHALNLALWSRRRAPAAGACGNETTAQTMCQSGTHLFEGTLRRCSGTRWFDLERVPREGRKHATIRFHSGATQRLRVRESQAQTRRRAARISSTSPPARAGSASRALGPIPSWRSATWPRRRSSFGSTGSAGPREATAAGTGAVHSITVPG